MKVEVQGIDWDTDGEDVDLPSSVTMEVEDDDATYDDILDELSNEYGWCIKGVERLEIC
jgi:hypothetical protein